MQIPLLDLKAQYYSIKEEIDEAIRDVLDSGQFILGKYVQKLEEEVAGYANVKYGIGVASGTDALVLALTSLGIGRGDEVLQRHLHSLPLLRRFQEWGQLRCS